MRLTYKINDKQYAPRKNTGWKTFDKLGQLEDIEDELGLPLKIYLKLRYDTRIYHEDGKDYYINAINKSNHIRAVRLKDENPSKEESVYVALCEYGKTWALTKEELL